MLGILHASCRMMEKEFSERVAVSGDAAADPAPASPRPVANPRSLLGARVPLRILAADDVRTNRELLRQLTAFFGYQAEIVENGADVLAALSRRPFDLILLDVQMPVMDGLMATQEIRRRFPPECQPAIIAFTANTLSGDRERCLAAGMDDYLSKPVDPAEMAAKLERWNAVLLKDGRGSFVPLFQKSPDLQPA